MAEWDIVLVIVVLIGLGASVMRPMLKLNTTITLLNANVERVGERLDDLSEKNRESHARIWAKNDEQDQVLQCHDHTLRDHEVRIKRVEKQP